MTNQELLHHVRRNKDIMKLALQASEAVASIDGANVNVHFDIERYRRQHEAFLDAEAAMIRAQ